MNNPPRPFVAGSGWSAFPGFSAGEVPSSAEKSGKKHRTGSEISPQSLLLEEKVPSEREADVVVSRSDKLKYYGCFAAYTTSVTCGDSFSSRRSHGWQGLPVSKSDALHKTVPFCPHSTSAPVCALGHLLPGRRYAPAALIAAPPPLRGHAPPKCSHCEAPKGLWQSPR